MNLDFENLHNQSDCLSCTPRWSIEMTNHPIFKILIQKTKAKFQEHDLELDDDLLINILNEQK